MSGKIEHVASWAGGVLLIGALILGGQTHASLAEALVQSWAVITLLLLTLSGDVERIWRSYRGVCLLVAAVLLLPMAQLLPLPFGLWRGLPGHAVPADILGFVNARSAHPLTLDPAATVTSGLALLPAIAMLFAVLAADGRGRALIARIALAGIVGAALLGAAQLAFGPAFYPLETPHIGRAVGFFVNRNHHADLMLLGMPLAGAVMGERGTSSARIVGAGLILLFACAVITTASRLGAALLPIGVLGGLYLLFAPQRKQALLAVGVCAALLLSGYILAQENAMVAATLHRFANLDDARFGFWSDSWYAARQFWPLGSGLGTFVPVYAAFENLDHVRDFYANAAHNDYLQLLLESGIAFPLLLAGFGTILYLGFRQVPADRSQPLRIAGLLGLGIVVAHSVADYPLRTAALMTMFGWLAGQAFPTINRLDFTRERLEKRRTPA